MHFIRNLFSHINKNQITIDTNSNKGLFPHRLVIDIEVVDVEKSLFHYTKSSYYDSRINDQIRANARNCHIEPQIIRDFEHMLTDNFNNKNIQDHQIFLSRSWNSMSCIDLNESNEEKIYTLLIDQFVQHKVGDIYTNITMLKQSVINKLHYIQRESKPELLCWFLITMSKKDHHTDNIYHDIYQSLALMIRHNIRIIGEETSPRSCHGIFMHGPVVKIFYAKYLKENLIQTKMYPSAGFNLMHVEDKLRFIECIQRLYIEYDIMYNNL